MPAPFAQMPTLGELLVYLEEEAGCRVERNSLLITITGPLSAATAPVTIGTESPESSRLTPQALDIFCYRLGLDLREHFAPALNGDENVSFGKYPRKPK